MKSYFCITLLLVLFFATSGKAQSASQADSNKPMVQSKLRLDTGWVSHRYSSSGGRVVIMTNKVMNGDTLMFTPMQGLGEFDVDGLEISFNYAPLGIRHLKGCGKAEPVLLRNIKKINQ